MQGVILFAHGSRDPMWRGPIEAIATQVLALSPATHVACAYLELCEPDLPTAVQTLANKGVTQVNLLPVFFGMGKHAREDLPVLVQELRDTHPQVAIHVQPAIGEEPRMTALMADIACERPAA